MLGHRHLYYHRPTYRGLRANANPSRLLVWGGPTRRHRFPGYATELVWTRGHSLYGDFIRGVLHMQNFRLLLRFIRCVDTDFQFSETCSL